MKKYFLGITAVVLALGFSAFTSGIKHDATKAKATNLYWYLFNGSQITTLVGTGPMDRVSAEDATGCFDVANKPICAYGYSTAQSPLPKAPGAHDDQIRKTN